MLIFLLIASAHFLALLSPGPDFFLILKTSVLHGRVTAMILSLGIAVGHCGYLLLVFFGLDFFKHHPLLFQGLQILGIAYLGYLAWQMLGMTSSQPRSLDVPEHAGTASNLSWRKAALQGLLVSLLNPKNAVFYASLISVLDPQISLLLKVLYILWMSMVVLCWDCLIAVLSSQKLVLNFFARHFAQLEKITALILLGLALLIGFRLLST